MDTVIHGLLFDLDNTLFDRHATFVRVASNFYEEYLSATASITRDDAVGRMVRWDADGYAKKEKVFTR